MRHRDPNDTLDPNRTTINKNTYPAAERSGMGMMGMMIAIALAVGLGLFAWSAVGNSRVADNTAPGVTTGSSTRPTTPAPAPTAPAPTAPATGSTTTR